MSKPRYYWPVRFYIYICVHFLGVDLLMFLLVLLIWAFAKITMDFAETCLFVAATKRSMAVENCYDFAELIFCIDTRISRIFAIWSSLFVIDIETIDIFV